MEKKCRSCGCENSDSSVFCMNCGARLDDGGDDAETPRLCPHCGARLTGDYAFCPKCGAPTTDKGPQTPLSAQQPIPQRQPAAPVKKSHTGLIVGLCIAAFALIATVVVAITLLLGAIKSYEVDNSSGHIVTSESEGSFASTQSESTSIPAPAVPNVEHSALDFSSITYSRPDVDAISAKINECLELAKAGGDTEEVLSQADEIRKELNSTMTMYSYADLQTSLDYTDSYYAGEVSWLLEGMDKLDNEFNELTSYLANSDGYSDALHKRWGDDYVACCLSAGNMNNDKVAELTAEEEELSSEYDTIMKETSVNVDGKDWSYDTISADTELDLDSYRSVYEALTKALNAKAGPLYIKLLGVRTQIAKELGYSSYTEYAYDYQGRDYSPADAKRLQESAKTYIAPIYSKVYTMSYDTNYSALYSESYDSQVMLPKLYEMMKKISPSVSESLGYMLSSGLYDIDMRDKKLSGGFTTYLTDYKAPFLYTNWTGAWGSVSDLTHELGHFNSYYWRAEYGWNIPDGTDIAEVDSQGLVLLSTQYYEDLYGSDVANAARMEELLDSMYSILSGCMEDEFQQTIYANPDMTLDEMNQLYYKLSVEYGLQDIYQTLPEEWVLISHTFQSPLYYISYAAAMVPAAEIWMDSLDDYQGAVNRYESVVYRNPYDGFLTVLGDSGLSDPFDPATIKNLADEFYSYAGKLAG